MNWYWVLVPLIVVIILKIRRDILDNRYEKRRLANLKEDIAKSNKVIERKIPSEELKKTAWLILDRILGEKTPKITLMNGEIKLVVRYKSIAEMVAHQIETEESGTELIIDHFGLIFFNNEVKVIERYYKLANYEFYYFLIDNIEKIIDIKGWKDVLKFVIPKPN